MAVDNDLFSSAKDQSLIGRLVKQFAAVKHKSELLQIEPMNRDYFAEMYVAGILADRNWNIYFPRRDKGFDMIITRETEAGMLVRPVQVKGKYPREAKTDKRNYGYVGDLTHLHPDMVLIIPFFPTDIAGAAPVHIAYMPRSEIRNQASKGFACMPARFTNGKACPRPNFECYFDSEGLTALEARNWGASGWNNVIRSFAEMVRPSRVEGAA